MIQPLCRILQPLSREPKGATKALPNDVSPPGPSMYSLSMYNEQLVCAAGALRTSKLQISLGKDPAACALHILALPLPFAGTAC